MNKVLAFLMLVHMLFACTNGSSTGKPTSQDSAVASYTFEDDTHTSEARRALDPIVKQYPNYRDNELRRMNSSNHWRNTSPLVLASHSTSSTTSSLSMMKSTR